MRVNTASGLESQFFMRVNTACISNWIRTGIRELWGSGSVFRIRSWESLYFCESEYRLWLGMSMFHDWEYRLWMEKYVLQAKEYRLLLGMSMFQWVRIRLWLGMSMFHDWEYHLWMEKYVLQAKEYRLLLGMSMFLWVGIPPLGGKVYVSVIWNTAPGWERAVDG